MDIRSGSTYYLGVDVIDLKEVNMAAKKNLTGAERRVANYRAKGLSFRAISEKMGHSGDNGTWAFRMCRRIGVK